MNKLWIRLSLAFGLVAVVGVLAAAVLASRQVGSRFGRFVADSRMLDLGEGGGEGSSLVARLADHYARTGGWSGVEAVVEAAPHVWRGSDAMGPRWGMRHVPRFVVVADAAGAVVFNGPGKPISTHLSRDELRDALPVSSGGQTVGYVLVRPPGPAGLTGAERDFVDQVNRSLLEAGLIAGGLGVLLGLAIARGLAAPLSQLAAAARRISRGDLGQRVPVGGADEVADLARAFNEMAVGLQQAETLRANMVADIAHELRMPLSVIQGSLRAILDDVYPLEMAEIATVYDETLMLNRLVNDLRELAFAEAGQLGLDTGPVAVASVIEGAVALFVEPAGERGVALNLELPANLPPVLADSDRTRQVIRNLLANALRHTPEGGQIRLAAELADRVGAFVQVSVSDTGPGVPAEHLPHVFDRFWRAEESRAREHGGAGLGLAIARQLVEAQGGEIGVESEEGHGSCFWFTLPVVARSGKPVHQHQRSRDDLTGGHDASARAVGGPEGGSASEDV